MRILFLNFLFLLFLGAKDLDEVVKNLVGDASYQINQNFIQRLFQNSKEFYTQEEQLDFYKITKILKDNGLFNVSFSNPVELSLGFEAQTKPIFLIRTLNHIFSNIGYSYSTISKADFIEGQTKLTFAIQTEVVVDPVILLNELKKRGFYVNHITRENEYQWRYELVREKSVLAEATKIELGDRLDIKNIAGEYWFDVDEMGVLEVVAQNQRLEWSPKVVFYDKDLEILNIFTQEELVSGAQIEIFDGVRYVMITDLYHSAKLKQGIVATFNSPEDA